MQVLGRIVDQLSYSQSLSLTFCKIDPFLFAAKKVRSVLENNCQRSLKCCCYCCCFCHLFEGVSGMKQTNKENSANSREISTIIWCTAADSCLLLRCRTKWCKKRSVKGRTPSVHECDFVCTGSPAAVSKCPSFLVPVEVTQLCNRHFPPMHFRLRRLSALVHYCSWVNELSFDSLWLSVDSDSTRECVPTWWDSSRLYQWSRTVLSW